MSGTKALGAIVGGLILMVLVVMFLNKGGLSVGASPKGATFGVSY